MNEEGGALGMCGIAMLENVNDAVRVNREVRFFRGHEKLDRAYGWGMRWMEGRNKWPALSGKQCSGIRMAKSKKDFRPIACFSVKAPSF